MATEPAFRVTTYKVPVGDFSGNNYKLHLRYTLLRNYFVMLQWQVANGGPFNVMDVCVGVIEDPYGTGDLLQSNGNWLTLRREGVSAGTADLIVTVVECLKDEGGAGFRLLDVQNVSLAATAVIGVQATTDTSATAWSDASRVVLFGGYRGGGMLAPGANASDVIQTAGCRIYPSGSATINIERYASGAAKLRAATAIVYVVEWGLEWTVQRATVTGTNTNATLGVLAAYSTAAIKSTPRANTFVWGCGYTDGSGPGDSAMGQVVTIGDGVNKNTNETTVAVGGATAITQRGFEVYVLTHAKLTAQQVFRAIGAAGPQALTVTAPSSGVDTYYTAADTLYVPGVVGSRLVSLYQGMNDNVANNLGEIFFAVDPTSATAVQASIDDPAPTNNWAAWLQLADFVGITVTTDALPTFRVTSYRITGTTWAAGALTYDLPLLYDLSSNYFVMVEGAEPLGGPSPDPDDCSAYVSQDPWGTGDLAVSASSKTIRLARSGSAQPWRGVVTVVECLRGSGSQGFRLVDVRSIALPAFADTGVQTVVGGLTAGQTWTDPERVVLFAGWRGGGVQPVGAHVAGDIQSLGVAAVPTGTSGLQFHRYTNSNTRLKAVNVVCYAVEWGTEWQVQRVLAAGVAGGTDINATNEYQVFALDAAVPVSKSWLWAGVTAEDDETFHSWLSGAVTLGDGVSQLANEDRVAIGLWAADAFLASVYVLTHSSITTSWVFQATTATGSANLTVAAPTRSESYLTLSGNNVVCGRRFGVAYTAASDGALTNIAAASLYPTLAGQTTLNLSRDRTEGNWAGWAQAVDLGALMTATGGVQIDDSAYTSPQSYLILQDPQWSGSASVASATSQAGLLAGPVDPDATNLGLVSGYQEGSPSGTDEFDYWLSGGVNAGGGWLYRLTSETTAASWKAINCLTTLWRQKSYTSIGAPPTQSLYAQDVAYSTAYSRLVGAWVHSDGSVRIERQNTGTPLDAYTSATIGTAGYSADATKEGGIGLCELPDGSLLLLYQMVDTNNGFLNFNSHVSTDGGVTWSVAQRRILSRTTATSQGSSGGQLLVRSSGDWVRAMWNSSNVGATGIAVASQKTIVSPDRGASWSYIGTFSTYPWKAPFGFAGSAPTAMEGLGDASGTFLMAYLGSLGSTTIKFAIASRDDNWENVAALDWDISAYATTARVKGLCLVRDPDRLWCYAWVEGTDKSEIIVRVCKDPTDPENSANWTDLGQLSGFGGVLRYGPHCWRGVWAGNRIVLSGGIQDPDVGATADPVVVGHWSLQSGSWDPRPWDYTILDGTNNDYLTSGYRSIYYQWMPASGDPAGGGADSDGLTPWTRTTAGVVTFTWSKSKYRISTADAAGVGRFNLALGVPAAASDRWGSGERGFAWHFRWLQEASRVLPSANEDCGVRIKALSSGGATGYDYTFRIGPTEVTLYDNNAGAARVTQATTDFASECEFRIAQKSGTINIAWRKVSDGPLAAWTELGGAGTTYTVNSAALAAQELRWGILAATSAGISTLECSDVVMSYRSDFGQRADVSKPAELMGTKLNRGPILVRNGVSVRWGGAGAYQGDGFTGRMEYGRGYTNLGIDSPRDYWESTSLAENALVFAANSSSASARWHMNALMLVGTVDRTAKLQFSNTNTDAAWLAPAAEFDLDADVYTDLTVVAIDGSSLQLQAASGQTFTPRRGSMVQLYIRFVASGAATGATLRVINDVHDSRWWHVDDGVDLVGIGVAIGAKAVVFCDRMVFMGLTFQRYAYHRVVFPDLTSVGSRGTYTGTHRLGSMVPGFWQRFSVPIDWSFRDNEQPNITQLRAKGGATWEYEEGPPQRIIDGKVVGDAEEFRHSLRDMLKRFHGYSRRPAGLILDSRNVGPDTAIFGRWSDGGQLDQAAYYRDTGGVWRPAGDIDVTFTEEV
jgi:hypothetical protein